MIGQYHLFRALFSQNHLLPSRTKLRLNSRSHLPSQRTKCGRCRTRTYGPFRVYSLARSCITTLPIFQSAETERFELPVPLDTTVFKTAALNRSAMSPAMWARRESNPQALRHQFLRLACIPNSTTSPYSSTDIIQHQSCMYIFFVREPRFELGSIAWKAMMLAITPHPHCPLARATELVSCVAISHWAIRW